MQQQDIVEEYDAFNPPLSGEAISSDTNLRGEKRVISYENFMANREINNFSPSVTS